MELVLESMAGNWRSRSGKICAVRTVLWKQTWVVKRKREGAGRLKRRLLKCKQGEKAYNDIVLYLPLNNNNSEHFYMLYLYLVKRTGHA